MMEKDMGFEGLEQNKEVFDAAEGLRNAADDEELYVEVLEIYLEDYKQQEADLSNYLEKGDLENYRILVHGIKNNLRIGGASLAAKVALDLEMHCKEGNLEYVKEHHSDLIREAARAIRYFRQYLDANK